MGVRIRTATTPHGWWGVYDHQRRLITLRPGMAPIQARCTLMHELGHAHYGHEGVDGKQEFQANRWAARRLLDLDEVAEAARQEQCGAAAAARLDVLPSVLNIYLRTLTDEEKRLIWAASRRRVA